MVVAPAVMPLLILWATGGFWLSQTRELKAVSEEDPWMVLLEALSKTQVEAQIHRELSQAYGLTEATAGGYSGKIEGFSRSRFPVTLGLSEEWPSVYSGSIHLLQDPLYGRLLALCSTARKERLDRHTLLERLFFQADLWAIYDSLFTQGASPRYRGEFRPERWQKLLLEIATLMRGVALTVVEIAHLPSSSEIREEIFRQNGASARSALEFYTLETYLVHDLASRFRKSHHFYYWDPQRDFRSLNSKEIAALNTRTLPLNQGAVAMIEEDLTAVLRDGSLYPTPVPVLFKVYVVEKPTGKQPLRFAMYRIDRKARDLGVGSIRPLPKETEAWAHIDLPNMPSREKPGYRAPMAVACSGCHGIYPNGFCPGIQPLDPSLYRLCSGPQTYSSRRNMEVKSGSIEYLAMKQDFQISAEDETKEGASEREAEAESRPEVEGRVSLGIARIGGFVVLALVIYLIRRYLRRPAQQEA